LAFPAHSCLSGRSLRNQRGEKFEYQFHSHVRPESAENARL
jgi:hypothetical protein